MLEATIKVDKNNIDVVINELNAKKETTLAAVGDAVISNVKILTPVGTPESTGIKGYVGGTLKGSFDRIVDDDAVIIGTNVPYAKYVEDEEDTLKQKHRTGQSHFLRDGITLHIDEYKRLFEDLLTR